MAGHRASPGRRPPAVPTPARGRAAHRAPAVGPGPAHVVASVGTAGAVVTGTLTALLMPGASTPVARAGGADPVLTAHEGVLRPDAATGPVVPVASALDEGDRLAATEQRVASVEKAGRLAAQLAELHAREQRAQADRARNAALIRTGGVDGWIAEALQVMDLPQNLAPSVKRIVMAESGGNPRAVNRWDSNARRGTPSRGLMQTVPSTFRAFVHPELAGRPITDPVANITAGVRYMVSRYGMDTLQAGGRRGAGGAYRGY